MTDIEIVARNLDGCTHQLRQLAKRTAPLDSDLSHTLATLGANLAMEALTLRATAKEVQHV